MQLIQFIDPTPIEDNNNYYTYADITDKYSDQEKETITNLDNYTVNVTHIDVKNIIKKLNNSLGFLAVRNQLKKTLEEKYTPDIWNSWNYFNPMELKDAPNQKIKSFLTNLYKIKEYDPDFYFFLYVTYTDIINNITDYKQMASRISKLQNKVNEFESMFDKQIIHIENEIRKNVYSEFITILGIFTAITFAIFGGMNLLSALFKNIGSTPASLGQTLILAAVFGLIMWGITVLFFYWINTIKTNHDKKFYRQWGFWLNVLFIVLVILLLIAGIFLFLKKIK